MIFWMLLEGKFSWKQGMVQQIIEAEDHLSLQVVLRPKWMCWWIMIHHKRSWNHGHDHNQHGHDHDDHDDLMMVKLIDICDLLSLNFAIFLADTGAFFEKAALFVFTLMCWFPCCCLEGQLFAMCFKILPKLWLSELPHWWIKLYPLGPRNPTPKTSAPALSKSGLQNQQRLDSEIQYLRCRFLFHHG